MKRLIKLCFFLFSLPFYSSAQKDCIRLVCPLNEATVVPPPKTQVPEEPDLCIVLLSVTDTAVKAVTNGKVTSVVESEQEKGKWEVVFFSRYKNLDYYFWYSGLTSAVVKRNQVLKEGQPIGYVKPGEKIELLMYDFETPLDPTKYLTCK